MNSPITPELGIEAPDPDHENPHPGPTGPRTAAGKEISSANATKHGCCSEKTVLRHEDPAKFEAARQGWFDQYRPEPGTATTLVEETARAHWMLMRAQKRLEDIEYNLPMNAYHWTAENERLFANFTRYKTTAERAFFRFFRELETYFNRLDRKEQSQQRALAQAAAIERPALPTNEKISTEPIIEPAPIEKPLLYSPRVPSKEIKPPPPSPKY